MPDIQGDQQTGRDTQGKATDLDKGIEFLFAQLADGDFPVISEHSMSILAYGRDQDFLKMLHPSPQ
jgi:hypothetical protein